MRYAIFVGEDTRILYGVLMETESVPEKAVVVEELPAGNLTDYCYVDGEFVYKPLIRYVIAPRNLTEGEYITVNGILYKATANIPGGERIITGHNAIETTIEAQLHELAEGE